MPAAPAPSQVRRLPAPAVIVGVVVGVLAVSTAGILVRLAEAPSLALAFWRCGLGALALAPFALRHPPVLTRAQRWQLVGSGACLALHFALFISSLSFTTVASSAVLVGMSPLFVGIGAALFLREPPSARTWRGIALATLGAVVIAAADLRGSGLGPRALLGDGLALGGAVGVAGYLLIGRAVRQRLPVTVYAAAVYGVAAALLLVACLVTGADLGGYSAATWGAVAGLVIGPQLLGHTVFNTLLSTLTATAVAVVILAEPVGATVLAFLVLAELPAPVFWAGAPLVLLGVWLAVTTPFCHPEQRIRRDK